MTELPALDGAEKVEVVGVLFSFLSPNSELPIGEENVLLDSDLPLSDVGLLPKSELDWLPPKNVESVFSDGLLMVILDWEEAIPLPNNEPPGEVKVDCCSFLDSEYVD